MSKNQKITFYCNECDEFPSGVDVTAYGQSNTIYIECKDCNSIQKLTS